MAISYFPFDAGAGSNVKEAQWGMMAQNWLGTGVIKNILNEFLAYADSTGMQVKVKSGQAWIEGFFIQSDAETVMPISTANPTLNRIDRVILRVDWTANTIAIAVLTGTAAASPSPPALTQNVAKWEISLAQVYVAAAAATIAAGNITDERFYTMAWNNNGIMTMQSQPGFSSLLGSGNLSVPSSTDTLLPFAGIAGDTHGSGAMAAGVYTVPENGVYLISVTAAIGAAAGSTLELKFYKGTSVLQWAERLQNNGATTFTSIVNAVGAFYFNKGDQIKFYVYSSAASTVDKGNTWCTIAKLS